MFRGFEQLSRLASYGHGKNTPWVSICADIIFTNFCFLSHNFGTRYASKPIKGSKDSDGSLIPKKTLTKKWLVGLASRARKPRP